MTRSMIVSGEYTIEHLLENTHGLMLDRHEAVSILELLRKAEETDENKWLKRKVEQYIQAKWA